MSYQSDPLENEIIRNRIRQILNEKARDRTYKGEAYEDMDYYGKAYVGGAKRGRPKGSTSKAKAKPKAAKRGRPRKTAAKRGRPRKTAPKVSASQFTKSQLKALCQGIKSKDPNRVSAGKRASKANPWLIFYREWIKRNRTPDMKVSEAAKLASQAYHSGSQF